MLDPINVINIIKMYPTLKKIITLFVVLIFIIYSLKNNLIPFSIELFKITDIFFGFLVGLLNFYLLIFISRLLKKLSLTKDHSQSKSIIKENLNAGPYILSAILTVLYIILFSFMEEVIFRSIILNYLIEKLNIPLGVLVSSALFSLYHFNNKILQLFVMGIILSTLVLITDNLFSVIIAHITSNMMVFFVHNANVRKIRRVVHE